MERKRDFRLAGYSPISAQPLSLANRFATARTGYLLDPRV